MVDNTSRRSDTQHMFVELSNEVINDETKYLVYFYNVEKETYNNAFLLIFHGGYVNWGG